MLCCAPAWARRSWMSADAGAAMGVGCGGSGRVSMVAMDREGRSMKSEI